MQKYSTLFILLLLFACAPTKNNKIPDNVLPPDKMVDMMADLHISEMIVRNSPHGGDTNILNALGYNNFVYQKYGVTDSIFKLSYDFYVHNPIMLDSIYAKLITRLSEKQSQLKEKK